MNHAEWFSTFVEPNHSQVRTFLQKYQAAADKLATDATAAGSGHTSHLRWPRVPTLTLHQTTLRPGAQNTIYIFSTLRPITADLRYNVANIQLAAADLQFPDEEAIHELTIGGASLGNPELPLTTHICRNHQGSAKHWHAVTDQLRQWIDGKELRGPHAEALDDSRFDGFAYPAAIPAIAVPINGTESRLRGKDYHLQRAGLPFQVKVRPTFDLSSPHDSDSSPNGFCVIDPMTQTPWTTADHVAADLVPLSTAAPPGCPLRGFKVDLHAAYRQLHARRADRWQQQIFWRFPVNGVMRGGWFEDTRMMWGGKRAGIIFHRAVTSLVVLFIHQKLQTDWLPLISDPTTNEWISARRAAGYATPQLLPAIVKGFLDDFFFIIAGSASDQERAHSIIFNALHFLGFALSESKLISDGPLTTKIDILGHFFDLANMTRGVPQYKQTRAKDTIADLLHHKAWKLESLQSLLGLLQSGRLLRQESHLPTTPPFTTG